MLETTPTPSTGWTHVALFLLLWIEHPVGTSPQGPWVSQQQPQEPINREFFLDPPKSIIIQRYMDHPTDNLDDIERYAHLVCIQ
jgi:hypothetical protein